MICLNIIGVFVPGTRKQIPPAFWFSGPIIRFFSFLFRIRFLFRFLYSPAGSARMGGRICLRPAFITAGKFICACEILKRFVFRFCFAGFQGIPLFSKALTSVSNIFTALVKKSIIINTKTASLSYFFF